LGSSESGHGELSHPSGGVGGPMLPHLSGEFGGVVDNVEVDLAMERLAVVIGTGCVGDWVKRKVGSVWKLLRGKKEQREECEEVKRVRAKSWTLGVFSKFVTNQSIEQLIKLYLVSLTPCMTSLSLSRSKFFHCIISC
jgi:hypothetical protein